LVDSTALNVPNGLKAKTAWSSIEGAKTTKEGVFTVIRLLKDAPANANP